MKRVCPACTRRTAELVDPECVVCLGDGFLTLHPAALSIYEPAVLAEAVALSLEGMARMVEQTTTLSDDRRAALAAKARELVLARIITQPGLAPQPARKPLAPTAKRGRKRRHQIAAGQLSFAESPTVIVEAVTGKAPTVYDSPVLNAPAHTYAATDRPLMRGLPLLSAAGHPSHLARIEDPQDSYASTSQEAAERTRRTRQATVLVASVPLVIAERNKTA